MHALPWSLITHEPTTENCSRYSIYHVHTIFFVDLMARKHIQKMAIRKCPFNQLLRLSSIDLMQSGEFHLTFHSTVETVVAHNWNGQSYLASLWMMMIIIKWWWQSNWHHITSDVGSEWVTLLFSWPDSIEWIGQKRWWHWRMDINNINNKIYNNSIIHNEILLLLIKNQFNSNRSIQ